MSCFSKYLCGKLLFAECSGEQLAQSRYADALRQEITRATSSSQDRRPTSCATKPPSDRIDDKGKDTRFSDPIW